jgi:hypothetical protein
MQVRRTPEVSRDPWLYDVLVFMLSSKVLAASGRRVTGRSVPAIALGIGSVTARGHRPRMGRGTDAFGGIHVGISREVQGFTDSRSGAGPTGSAPFPRSDYLLPPNRPLIQNAAAAEPQLRQTSGPVVALALL